MEDFRNYLEAVCQAPRLRGTCRTYVETEVADRLRLSKPEEEFDPFGNFLDMGLMAQTIEPCKKWEEIDKDAWINMDIDAWNNISNIIKPDKLPVLEAVCKYAAGHVLLVGRPGSGKTTALEKLLVQEAEAALGDNTVRVPVLVRLRDVRSTVLAQIGVELQHYGVRLGIEQIGELLWAGRFLVLLDGVNELPGELRGEVESFRREFQRTTPMIFTTRELNVGLDLGIEKKLEMQRLSEGQMGDFTCKYLGQEQGQKLIKGLGEKLQKFGETPLLLWMLCGVYKTLGEIPANLGGVFRGFARIYNQNRFDDRKSSEYSRFLQRLAVAMMPQDDPLGLRLSIPRAEVEEIFREFMQAERESNVLSGSIATLDELLRFHLLRPKDNEEIEFSHQLFQEYYAGEYLLGQLPKLTDLELQKCYLNYVDWTEAVALMAGLVGDGKQAVRLVELGLKVDLMLGARLAGEVLPQFQEQTVGLVTELDLPQWLKFELWEKTKSDRPVDSLIEALQDQNSFVRRNAAKALGKIGSERAIDSLIKALQDQSWYVRSNSAGALGNIGSEQTVYVLIKALQDQDSSVRSHVVEALGKIGSERAIDSLIKALQDQDSSVRSHVVEALGKIGSERAIDSLIKTLQYPKEDVHSHVVEALGKISSEWAIDSLIKALQDQKADIRGKAAEVLGNINSERAVGVLIEALQDQDNSVRINVVEALGKIGSERAVDFLIKALQDRDLFVSWKAGYALGQIGSERAVGVLIEALQDQSQSWYVRGNTARALGQIGSERAVDMLIEALQDQNWSVSWNAIYALGQIGSERAVNVLIEALQDQQEAIRSKAAEALGNIGSERAVDSLIEALQDQKADTRMKAVEALGKIGSEQSVDSLIKALQDQGCYVRGKAAEALGNIGSIRSVDFLIKALQDQGCYVRSEAARALGKIGSKQSVNSLIKALQDQDDNVRSNVVEALGNIGSSRSVAFLIKAFQDQNSSVRINVAEALGKISSEQAIDGLINALQHQPWNVCWRAAKVLGNIGSSKLISQLWEIYRLRLKVVVQCDVISNRRLTV